jgi:hypothetical protein
LPRLLEPLAAGTADLVLGSRVRGGAERGALAPHQRFGNALTAALMRRLYGIAVTDLGPYRAIRADLLDAIDMHEMTYGWPTEMTVKAARRGARVVEVPVTLGQSARRPLQGQRHGARQRVGRGLHPGRDAALCATEVLRRLGSIWQIEEDKNLTQRSQRKERQEIVFLGVLCVLSDLCVRSSSLQSAQSAD